MGSVYLINNRNYFNPQELKHKSSRCFWSIRRGDYLRVENNTYRVLSKIYDPEDMSIYIEISDRPILRG